MTNRNGSLKSKEVVLVTLLDSDDEEMDDGRVGALNGGRDWHQNQHPQEHEHSHLTNGNGGGTNGFRRSPTMPSLSHHDQEEESSTSVYGTVSALSGGCSMMEGMILDVNRLSVASLRSIVSSMIVENLPIEEASSSRSKCNNCDLLSSNILQLKNEQSKNKADMKELEKVNDKLRKELEQEKAAKAQMERKLEKMASNLGKLQEVTNTLGGTHEIKNQEEEEGKEEEQQQQQTSSSSSVSNTVVSIGTLKVEENENEKEEETQILMQNLKTEQVQSTVEPTPCSSASLPPPVPSTSNGSAAPPPPPAPNNTVPPHLTWLLNGHSSYAYHPHHHCRQDNSKENGIFCICGQQFANKNTFYYHVRKMTSATFGLHKFSCPYCTKKFPVFSVLKKHMESKHRMAYKEGSVGCRYCGGVFPTRIRLLLHQRVVHKGGHHRLASWFNHCLTNRQEGQGTGAQASGNLNLSPLFPLFPVFPPQEHPQQVENGHQYQEEDVNRMEIRSDTIDDHDVIIIDSDDDDESPSIPSVPSSSSSGAVNHEHFRDVTMNIVERPPSPRVVEKRGIISPAFRLSGMGMSPVRVATPSFLFGPQNVGSQALAVPSSNGVSGVVPSRIRYYRQRQRMPEAGVGDTTNGVDGDDGYTYIDYFIRA